VLFDPPGNCGKMLVFLADVVFLAQVYQIDNWLGCEKEQRVDDLDLTG
jgi:hypothetical protein